MSTVASTAETTPTGDVVRRTVTASTHVSGSPERVWSVLSHPGARWMLGANIETNFEIGSTITFEGHFFGRHFADHGTVLEVERPRLLHFTHFSPSYDMADVPENYHDITITLTPDAGGTHIEVVHRNIQTDEREANAIVQWRKALATLAQSRAGV